jgi:hypothetical protein
MCSPEILLAMRLGNLRIDNFNGWDLLESLEVNGINCPTSCHTTHFYNLMRLHLRRDPSSLMFPLLHLSSLETHISPGPDSHSYKLLNYLNCHARLLLPLEWPLSQRLEKCSVSNLTNTTLQHSQKKNKVMI